MSERGQREARYPIDEIFLERWSPRAFAPADVSDKDLFTLFEAARWAPSSFNHQPWRFVYARRGDPWFDGFIGLLRPFNTGWAKRASVIVFISSDTMIQLPGSAEPRPSHSNSFDAGAAWAFMALQATRLGLSTHGMSGVDFDRARVELDVPADFRIEAAIAIGRRGDKAHLPEQLQAREQPSGRKELEAFVHRGRFGARI
jgi:nitroreductase